MTRENKVVNATEAAGKTWANYQSKTVDDEDVISTHRRHGSSNSPEAEVRIRNDQSAMAVSYICRTL